MILFARARWVAQRFRYFVQVVRRQGKHYVRDFKVDIWAGLNLQVCWNNGGELLDLKIPSMRRSNEWVNLIILSFLKKLNFKGGKILRKKCKFCRRSVFSYYTPGGCVRGLHFNCIGMSLVFQITNSYTMFCENRHIFWSCGIFRCVLRFSVFIKSN